MQSRLAGCTKRLKCIFLALIFAVPLRAVSQGLNLDTNMTTDPELGGGPPSKYFGAAAGQAGEWFALSFGDPGPYILTGLDGLETNITLTHSGIGNGFAYRNEGNTGDLAALLNDAERIQTGFEYTLTGLDPGKYLVYSYAVRPNGTSGESYITIPGAEGEETKRVAGTMPGNRF